MNAADAHGIASTSPGSTPARPAPKVVEGSARMFESDFLEKFSRVHPATPAVLYLPLSGYCIYRAATASDLSAGGIALRVFAGYLAWTLFEYWLHRLFFHLPVVGPRTARLHFLIHGVHHDYPWDLGRLVIPPVPSAVMAAVFFAVLHTLFGTAMFAPFAGFVAGYVLYDTTHWYVHARAPRSRFGRWLRREHMVHHFKDPTHRFGVSCPWLDHIFRTTGERDTGGRSLMPFFRRPDGTLVDDETPVRTIMPFIMRGRNESCVYHDESYDISATRRWLRAFNRGHDGPPAGLFHLFIWGCARGLHERPGFNRFVSGGDLYNRKGVYITFAAKKEMRDDAPIVTIKLRFAPDESFATTVERINTSILEGRGDEKRTVDKELDLFMKLPRFVRGPIMTFLQWLDRVNLAPAFMIESDPLYTSLFVANLGSIGLDSTYHHLYEIGTCSLFAVLGTAKKEWSLDRHGRPASREILNVRWTLDERVADGFYSGVSLKYFRKIVENPAAFVDAPSGDAPSADNPAGAAPSAGAAGGQAFDGGERVADGSPVRAQLE